MLMPEPLKRATKENIGRLDPLWSIGTQLREGGTVTTTEKWAACNNSENPGELIEKLGDTPPYAYHQKHYYRAMYSASNSLFLVNPAANAEMAFHKPWGLNARWGLVPDHKYGLANDYCVIPLPVRPEHLFQA